MALSSKRRWIIAIILIVIAFAATAATFYLTIRKQPTRWIYCNTIIIDIPNMKSVKDPEFVRYPNHTVFRDNEGFYYIVMSVFKTDDKWLTGVARTKDLHNYSFVGFTPLEMDGKIAPHCIYNPDDGKFCLYYSDWKNITYYNGIRLARLGLAVGTDIKNPSTFTDYGYLTVEGMPDPLAPNFGWDPYIVKVEDTYYMLISAAKYEVHLATAKNLGTQWNYAKIAVTGTLENPTLFYLDSKWYMMLGIWNGTCYDLYSSENFRYWNIVKKNFFQDEKYSQLPSGSTSLIVNNTFYHLYQTPLETDRFQLSLAYIKVEDLIAEIAKIK